MMLTLTPEQEKLLNESEDLIHAAIHTYVPNAGRYGLCDYDDLAQIARMAVCKGLQTYDPAKAKFSTFIYTIVRNALYNSFRNLDDGIDQKVEFTEDVVEMNPELAYNNVTDINDKLLIEEGIRRIEECAAGYNGIIKKGAEAIKLTLLGYNSTDIAEMYGVTNKAVTAWIFRARQRLQAELKLLALLNNA